MNYILLISIVLEAVIAGLFLRTSMKKGKSYLYGITLTFAIYVVYDLIRLFAWNISGNILQASFFIATLAALYTAWKIYKKK